MTRPRLDVHASLRPAHSLTPLNGALSVGFTVGISHAGATQAMRLRSVTASGLSPYGSTGTSRHHSTTFAGRSNCRRATGIRGTGDPASGSVTIRSMVASTASKNSTPRCCRWSSVPSTGDTIFHVGFFLETNVRATSDREVQPQRVAGRLTKGYRQIHRQSQGGLVARFQMLRQLRLQPDCLPQLRPGWPTVPLRRPIVRRSAMSELRADVPGLAGFRERRSPAKWDLRRSRHRVRLTCD